MFGHFDSSRNKAIELRKLQILQRDYMINKSLWRMLTEQAPNNLILVWGPRPLIPSPCVHSLPLSHFHTHIKTKYNKVIIYYRGYIIINAPVKYFPPFKYLTKWQHKTRASKQKTDLNTPVIGPTAHNTPHNHINISTLSVIPNISPLTLHL